jgi:prevent-host-death family protein
MSITYSTYEAKTRFSEVLRQVREGATITVSYRGEPVAEIRPIRQKSEISKAESLETETQEEYLDGLRRQGIIHPAADPNRPIRPSAYVPGALERFLADRNE